MAALARPISGAQHVFYGMQRMLLLCVGRRGQGAAIAGMGP
jgi:hypothetical protein